MARASLTLLLALFLVPGPGVHAQEDAVHAGTPLAAVAEQLEGSVDAGAYAGVVAVVEYGGERILELAAGERVRGEGEALALDDIFRIYSMSKPITAVATLMLVEDGKLELDAPASKYLPELGGLTVGVEREPAGRDMTVRDLLRHTSGLTYGFFADTPVDRMLLERRVLDPRSSLEEMVTKLGELPLKHVPGTRYEYGISSDVLGRLVEVASGERFDRFLATRLFEPLGMVDTGFFVPAEKLERLVEIYERSSGELAPYREPGGASPTELPGLLSGGGGLFSTVEDYLRFCRMLAAGGRAGSKRLLSSESVAEMTRDQLGDLPRPSMTLGGGSFGLGLAVTTGSPSGGPSKGTYWWGGAAGTGFWIDPQEEVIGVFMIQNMMEMQHSAVFRSRVYRALAE